MKKTIVRDNIPNSHIRINCPKHGNQKTFILFEIDDEMATLIKTGCAVCFEHLPTENVDVLWNKYSKRKAIKEFAASGGNATLKKRGIEHYKKMGQLSVAKKKEMKAVEKSKNTNKTAP